MAEEEKQEQAEEQSEDVKGEEQKAQTQGDPEMEAKARNMGWVPQDEFKGDPEKHKPADEFLRRGEEVIGFIKKDRDKAQAQVSKLEGTVAELKESAKRIEKMNKVALDQVKEQAEKDFSARKRQAVELGDTDAFDAIEKEEKDANKAFADKVKPAPVKEGDGLPPAQQAVVESWMADNTWFNSNAEMGAVAGTYHGQLLEDKPGMTLAENLEATREYVKSRYPEKFSNGTTAKKGSPVEGASRTGQSGGGGALWSQISKADQTIANRQLEQGAFAKDGSGKEYKTKAARQEAWASVYLGEQA